MEIKQPIVERVDNKKPQWNGHSLPKRILTFSPEGKKEEEQQNWSGKEKRED